MKSNIKEIICNILARIQIVKEWFIKMTNNMSTLTKNNWILLAIRSGLLLFYLFSSIIDILSKAKPLCDVVIWLFFMISMLHRISITDNESMGNQKVHKENFKPTKSRKIVSENRIALIVAILWLGVNLIFGLLYTFNALSAELMMLLVLMYSVCDIICILIYCPFQRWVLKNKCCITCRIYNWDYPMMFTPLIFIPTMYNYTLVGVSVLILIVWEYTYYKHPERFVEETNISLSCENCKEFMCKNSLRKVDVVKCKDKK